MNEKWRGGPAPHSQILGGGFLLAHNNVLRFCGAPNRLPSRTPPQGQLGKPVTIPPANLASHDGVAVESHTKPTHEMNRA